MATRRFSAQTSTITRELQVTMKKIGASSLKVNQDLFSGEAEIIFDRHGKRFVFRCKKWKDATDNLRASQLAIRYLHQAMEEYGVGTTESQLASTFDQFFAGFQAMPDDSVLMLGDGSAPWWETLGVNQGSAKADIISAFRALARVHHPDAGGDPEMFKRLRRAYERAIAERGARRLMRCLGLDLALGTVGWAVLDSDEQPVLIAKGSFQLPDRRQHKTIKERSDLWLARRSAELVANVERLLLEHGPVGMLAYEYPDFVRGPWSGGSKGRESSVMQAMGRAEGILVGHHGACRACGGRPLVGVSTSEAKLGFAGAKNASKAAVLSHCRLWFPGHSWSAERQDEADAVSIAWCALLASTADKRLAAVVGRRA